MKRTLDVAVAALLLVALSPIALLIAAILAFTGDRQVLYGQTRVGRKRREFRMFKFVSMRGGGNDEGGGKLTLPGDPRVLPFGRFLRQTKLNELPQLFNVIKGDMSLVGPRPQPPEIFAYYTEEDQQAIAAVRPGVTGVGSVVFRDEERMLQESPLPPQECHRDVFAPRKAQLETWYVGHQSLALDLKLMVLTAIAIIAPNGRTYDAGIASLGLPTWAAEPRREAFAAASAIAVATSARRGISPSPDARTPAPGP